MASGGAPRLSGRGNLWVVHPDDWAPESLLDTSERLATGDPGTATVLVATLPAELEELAELLAPAMRRSQKAGVRLLRLVMSGAGTEMSEQPSFARQLCDLWSLDVLAPDGRAVVVPGGTLFASCGSAIDGGWWHFSPGLTPRRIGMRYPEPRWQRAVERVNREVAAGHDVEHIPAGLLVRAIGREAEEAAAAALAVPMDPDRLVLLVDSEGADPVTPDALADVVAALPAQVRAAVRIAAADGAELLALGHQVADLLDLPIEIVNGLPAVLTDAGPYAEPRIVLLDERGEPTWQPYAETLACLPGSDGAPASTRIVAWRPPATGLSEGPEPGSLLLGDEWQVRVTAAGLWVGPLGGSPAAVDGRPRDAEMMSLELGMPGQWLSPSMWPSLERLLSELDDDVRNRTVMRLHGSCGAEGLRRLRRLAIRHGLAIAPGDRSSVAETRAPETPVHTILSPEPAPARASLAAKSRDMTSADDFAPPAPRVTVSSLPSALMEPAPAAAPERDDAVTASTTTPSAGLAVHVGRPGELPTGRDRQAEIDLVRRLATEAMRTHGEEAGRILMASSSPGGDAPPHAVQEDLALTLAYADSVATSLGRFAGVLSGAARGREALLARLDAGLHRLPVFRGVVVHGAPDTWDVHRIIPGMRMLCEGPVAAVPWEGEPLDMPAVRCMVWSETGRRPDMPRTTGQKAGVVILLAGTRLQVLAVEKDEDGWCVHLREIAADTTTPTGTTDGSDSQILSRLRELVRSAPARVAPRSPWPPGCSGSLSIVDR
ncbi:hypothetical protein SAMN05216259_12741 [Actinacidiphila guanduensis]|uniref:Uncharacterized protein n=1 Tax=Actinacidiphila guanduensis TaxID=310781 RepID=A0A1H0SE50_9ACTN|nr:hypothetical protein SAMN05216259_12741 [Actinacidiphila guanduensis]